MEMKRKKISVNERALELVSKMTLEEKISQLCIAPPAIPRLNLPKYNYLNEGSHGIFLLNCVNGKDTDVTCFPVCLSMSQSWDCDKVEKVSSAISDEARAYANVRGETLNYFTPTINLGRDPRNGRSDENFGEDPLLSGKMAASYIRGFQGTDQEYLKAVSTPKHFMMNSSENNRHSGSANADEATIREYYAKVFEYAVKEGNAASIMTSYNRINGIPASANEFMLKQLLRKEWGFEGFVISDAGAVDDVYKNPMFAPNKEDMAHYYGQDPYEAAAASLTAGLNVSLGSEYCRNLKTAYDKQLISEDDIDRSVYFSLLSRFKLGLFDEKEKVPYAFIGMEKVCSKENQNLCVDIANDSIVLLKNERGLLPLGKHQFKKILVVGPNAKFRQLGGYACGTINRLIDTPVNIMLLDGIKNRQKGQTVEVFYEKGWHTGEESAPNENSEENIALPGIDLADTWFDYMGFDITKDDIAKMESAPYRYDMNDNDKDISDDELFARALKIAKEADIVLMAVGTDGSTASEENDRTTLELPYQQDAKIREMLKANGNTVVILTTPGMVTGDFFDEAHTIVYAGFAGEAQGTAMANILYGDVNPNAKLTATWYQSESDLPHINDYGIKKQDTIDGKARTYMYFDGAVRFPFGYGLSYTEYEYSNMKLNKKILDANETLEVTLDVSNTGGMDGKEIIELYIRKESEQELGNGKPLKQLKAFSKVSIKAGETKTVTMRVPLKDLVFWSNLRKCMVIEPGTYAIEIGKSSADIVCSGEFAITGHWEPQLETVTIEPSKYIYSLNETGSLEIAAMLENCRFLDRDEFTLQLEASDPDILLIHEDALIKAIGEGVTTIHAAVTYKNKTRHTQVPIAVKR